LNWLKDQQEAKAFFMLDAAKSSHTGMGKGPNQLSLLDGCWTFPEPDNLLRLMPPELSRRGSGMTIEKNNGTEYDLQNLDKAIQLRSPIQRTFVE